MPQVSLDIDERTDEVLQELMKTFGVKSRSAAIRRAVALARINARYQQDDNTIKLLDKNDQPVKILLDG